MPENRSELESAYKLIDELKRRIAYLEATQDCCGNTKQLRYACREWLVMEDMLKAKHRFRRDGR